MFDVAGVQYNDECRDLEDPHIILKASVLLSSTMRHVYKAVHEVMPRNSKCLRGSEQMR